VPRFPSASLIPLEGRLTRGDQTRALGGKACSNAAIYPFAEGPVRKGHRQPYLQHTITWDFEESQNKGF